MDEAIQFFLIECHEEMTKLESNLIQLEKSPYDSELIKTIFRAVHSIKGTCGFLGFVKLGKIAHTAENLLSDLRDGKIKTSREIISALLTFISITNEIMVHIESTEKEGDNEYLDFIELLGKLKNSQAITTIQNSARPEKSSLSSEHSEPVTNDNSQIQNASQSINPELEVKSAIADSTIRVELKLLDKLMNLVGELVLNRNQLLQVSTNMKEPVLANGTQKLNLLTSELQEGIMKTRMQPIKNVWEKFTRVVRDMSLEMNKKIKIDFVGEDTEMDKSILEAIRDPLTHLIRNSIDHGIELPEARLLKGKNQEGKIQLKAYNEGGLVNIQVSDDGAGIDKEKVIQKALKKGLIIEEEISSMTENDILSLIMLPGFSTAEKVTSVSGRGVGMDVVKSNIEKIGGNILIQNEFGKGLTFKITIPLTLTIIPALIIHCRGLRFAIPQSSLIEVVELNLEQSKTQIEKIHNSYIYHLRGTLLSIVYLNELLKLKERRKQRRENTETNFSIIVVQSDKQSFGIVVDGVIDMEEVVVKPLGKHIQNIFAYSGVTILGDGKLSLILNIQGIGEKLLNNQKAKDDSNIKNLISGELISYVIFEIQKKYSLALPLSEILRIEEVSASNLKHSAGKTVFQFRDKYIPIMELSHILFHHDIGKIDYSSDDFLKVIVYQKNDISMGLVVDKIVDIVEGNFHIIKKDKSWHDLPIERDILGSIEIGKQVIDILDADSIIKTYKEMIQKEIMEA